MREVQTDEGFKQKRKKGKISKKLPAALQGSIFREKKAFSFILLCRIDVRSWTLL